MRIEGIRGPYPLREMQPGAVRPGSQAPRPAEAAFSGAAEALRGLEEELSRTGPLRADKLAEVRPKLAGEQPWDLQEVARKLLAALGPAGLLTGETDQAA